MVNNFVMYMAGVLYDVLEDDDSYGAILIFLFVLTGLVVAAIAPELLRQ